MLLAHDKHPGMHHGGHGPHHLVALTLLIGLAVIVAGLALYALVSTQWGLAPRLAPLAYLSLAMVAVMLLVNFAVTLLRSEMQAGLAMLAFWVLVFCGAFVGFQLLS